MNWEESVKAMKEGKKVTRACWKSRGLYLFIKKNECGNMVDIWLHSEDGTEKPCACHVALFEDDTWEVISEDKDWNLAKNSFITICDDFSELSISCDIKKCRDLILNDISNWYGGDHISMEFVEKRFGDLE